MVICNHSVDEYCRNSATSHWMLQKSCNRSVTRCRRKFCDYSVTCGNNSTITQFHVVAEILQSLSHWMSPRLGDHGISEKFCDHSVTSCRWNSATTKSLVIAEIAYSPSHSMSQKLWKHSSSSEYSNLEILLKPVNNKFHNIWSVILNHYMTYNNVGKVSNGTKPQN